MKVVAFGNGKTPNKQILEAIKENTMKSVTTIYKVYGCDTEGYRVLRAEFLDEALACKYAVRNEGKIHYYLPPVEKCTYVYDQSTGKVEATRKDIEPARIYYMSKI